MKIKATVLLSLLLLFLSSCAAQNDEEESVGRQDDGDSNFSNLEDDEDDFKSSDSENEIVDDNESNDAPESFCYSGGAVLYEGDQQFRVCSDDFSKVQKQICKGGKWVDSGECVLNYVAVPDGEFKMGCDKSLENDCPKDAVPAHKLRLSEYSIDKFEASVERFEQCIAAKACANDDPDRPLYRTFNESYSCNIGNSERSNHPANCVTWRGAKAFCEWVGKRLPTEAEWEKAAKAGNMQFYPWGNDPEANCDYAVMKSSANGCGYNATFPIGTKAKGISPYGLYDMSGNVAEYVSDWYDEDFYSTAEASSRDSQGPAEPGKNRFKVIRGGSYIYGEKRMRVYFRSSARLDDPAIDFGFRCASSN